MNHPETSVVIRTFNEEKFPPDLLATIKQQAYRNHETIVVDSGSMDRTREIAVQKADKLLAIESRDFTFGHSLNAGIQQTCGKYIVIVSAHTLPFNEYWLGNLSRSADDTTVRRSRPAGSGS
jgi:glycosyltransferase involved in cell wall biosynthesis